jgi:hypothetical protein
VASTPASRLWRGLRDGGSPRPPLVSRSYIRVYYYLYSGALASHGSTSTLGSTSLARDCLSTEHVPWRPAPERLRAVLQDTDSADLQKELLAERRRHESRGEMCGVRLPADRSAVPAGSLARLLLTY